MNFVRVEQITIKTKSYRTFLKYLEQKNDSQIYNMSLEGINKYRNDSLKLYR